jgi:hypothetical protein
MSGVDIAGLVGRLRKLKVWDDHESNQSLGDAAADALLAQAAELAEANGKLAGRMDYLVGLATTADKHAIAAAESATRQRDEALAALKASEEALRPFAKVAEQYDGVEHVRRQAALLHYLVDLTIEDFRRAHSALENGPSNLSKKDTGA